MERRGTSIASDQRMRPSIITLLSCVVTGCVATTQTSGLDTAEASQWMDEHMCGLVSAGIGAVLGASFGADHLTRR